MEIVVKHHGFPKTIVSDRDPIFVRKFWKQLFEASGTRLNHSTTYHPQTDGQTEVMNWRLEQYLRAMVLDRPHHLLRFLPWAKFSYNTSFHSSIKMTPYQALYGRLPPSVIPYPPGSSKVAAIDELLVERDDFLRQLKTNLLAAKNCMEMKANRKRHGVGFNPGDMVLVKLQPYRQVTLAKCFSNKLAKRYYGPFEVLGRVGKVAELPEEEHEGHPLEREEVVAKLPEEEHECHPLEQPLAICDSRLVLRNGLPTRRVLVQWVGSSPEEAAWEWLSEFQATYTSYHLEDKVIVEEEGNVTPTVIEEEGVTASAVEEE
ncbi:ty3-gypsy retrotransposon protein [Tanacetum coccineum]